MLLFEEYYKHHVSQYTYKEKQEMLYDLINEVKQNRAEERQYWEKREKAYQNKGIEEAPAEEAAPAE